MPIESFADKTSELFYYKGSIKKGVPWANLSNIVKRKLDMLSYAVSLDDLRSPPSNRLELLKGDFAGYHSIRINDQWRIVFKWVLSGAHEVRVIDYH